MSIVGPECLRSKLWSKLQAVPRDVLVLIVCAVSFVAFAVICSFVTGAPFVLPQGESPVLGAEATAPIVITVGVYLVAGLIARLRSGPNCGAERGGLSRMTVDLFLLCALAVVLYIHFHLKMWVPLLNDRSFDTTFFAIDEQFRFVIDGMRSVRAAFAKILPGVDSWYDISFFSLFFLSFWCHTAGTRRFLFHNMVAVTLVELVGPLIYLVAPAIGPFVFETGDNAHATVVQGQMHSQFTAMQAGGVPWFEANGAAYFTAPLAAMPSLHVAAAFVLAYYAVCARLLIAPYAVLCVCFIAVEAVVTRWHYLVDIPVGIGLAACAIVVTNRLCRFRLPQEEWTSTGALDGVRGFILSTANRRGA
mgnify:FL=1